MTTIVKNTFIDVDEGKSPNAKRRERRTKTEPSAGLLSCMANEEDSDEDVQDVPDPDEDEDSQPNITNVKTYDPFDRTASPLSPMRSDPSPNDRMSMDKRSVGLEVPVGDLAARSSKRKPSASSKPRRVAFCEADAGSGDEDDDADQPPGIPYMKTYDNFESLMASQQAQAAAVSPRSAQPQMLQQMPQQQQVGSPQSPQPMPQQLMAPQQPQVAMQLGVIGQPQGQVFTIPIPANLPVGASHAIQIPMGLPPGSTIIVMATLMAPAGAAPTAIAASPSPAQPPPPQPQQAHQAAVVAPAMPMMIQSVPAFGLATQAHSSSMGSPQSASQLMQPQTVSKTIRLDGTLRVTFAVDARKLKANDKVIISPPFEISSRHPGQYRVIINPTTIKVRGGPTFKNTNGLGNVQLKCEDRSEGRIAFSIFLCDGRPNSLRTEGPRGPVEHDFANGTVCGLPKKTEEWDFNRVVDPQSKIFAVCLDITP